jgi:hypothetical protein
MSTFKNVSADDRSVTVDGQWHHVAVGESFTVPDVYDDSLAEQPHFELVSEAKPPRGRRGAVVVGEPTDEEVTAENAAHIVDHEGTETVGEFSAATIAASTTAEATTEGEI